MHVRMFVSMLLAAALVSPLTADEVGEVATDGRSAPELPMLQPPPEVRALRAPEIEPTHIDLPPLTIPDDHMREIHLRTADFNGDGIVDTQDLLDFLARLGPCEAEYCRADLNGDGIVDELDLEIFLESFREVFGEVNSTQRVMVGYRADAPPNLVRAAPRVNVAGSEVVRIELHSAGSLGLRLRIADFAPDTGVELRIYDPAGEAVFGPYTYAHRALEDGSWWAPMIFGDTIGLEIIMPMDFPEDELFEIIEVTYLYCLGGNCHLGNYGGVFGCHNDISCHPAWKNEEGRGVANIFFIVSGGCVTCSGGLLDRTPGDLSPLFMTANHCISLQSEATTIEVFWRHETNTCNGAVPGFNILPRSDGSLLLKRHQNTDWCLLGLLDPPPTNANVFYLGWVGGNTNNWPTGNAATGIHHPGSSFKRISFGTNQGAVNNVNFQGLGYTVNCWQVSLTNGTTQPGSSGSPGLDSLGRVRGTLTGGFIQCAPTTMFYGRLANGAWSNVRFYLDPIATPTVYVNGGVSGDPGNNGATEQGTSSNPFNTVREATYCVIAGDEVRITAGTYNEQMTIWRPMTMTSSGGVVRIGAP